MAIAQTHIIQRQVLRLRVSSQPESWDLQQLATQVMQNSALLAALDEVLSAVVPSGEWLEINSLCIDLGVLQTHAFEKQFTERLPELLRTGLADALPAALQQGEATVKTQQQSVLEAFFYFLAHGLWPSGAPAPAGIPALEQQLLPLLPHLTDNQLIALQETLQNSNSRLRLVRQFSERLCSAVLTQTHAAAAPLATGILRTLNQMGAIPDAASSEQAWAWVLQQAVQHREEELTRFALFLKNFNPGQSIKSAAPATIAAAALAYLKSAAAGVVAGAADFLPPFQDKSIRKALGPDKMQDVAPVLPAPELPATAFYIQNAGVVLLHPFLLACFEACGWLAEDSKFRSEEAQAKAMLLIHFLATGEAQAAEYDQLLPKLLCGAPLTQAVPGHLHLEAPEQAEAIALLEAAIEHWAILKNTTPDGLREGFLQRDGKLEKQHDGSWVLTVEQKAQDLLLDRLPYGWGISMLQLPWMNHLLKINWV